MRRRQIKIERLFAAARTAPAEAREPMPTFLQTRILARLPGESRSGELVLALGRALRLGLGLALAVMLACVAWNYRDLSLQPNNDVELANVQAHLDLEL